MYVLKSCFLLDILCAFSTTFCFVLIFLRNCNTIVRDQHQEASRPLFARSNFLVKTCAVALQFSTTASQYSVPSLNSPFFSSTKCLWGSNFQKKNGILASQNWSKWQLELAKIKIRSLWNCGKSEFSKISKSEIDQSWTLRPSNLVKIGIFQ